MEQVSGPVADTFYETGGVRLYHSKFNLGWLSELELSPSVICDIGSYDGGDAIRFKMAFPRASVFAFEADPTRLKIVQANASKFGVTAVHAAVCDRTGWVDWYEARDQ